MKSLVFTIFLSSIITFSLFAKDHGWRSKEFGTATGSSIKLDIKLESKESSIRKKYSALILISLDDFMVDSAEAVIKNYSNGELVDSTKVELFHNNIDSLFEGSVPCGPETLSSYRNYRMQITYQEISVRVNDKKWLSVTGVDDSEFYFNIFELFDVRPELPRR